MNASLAFIPPNNSGTLIKYCVLEYAFREHFKWLRLCQCVYMKLSDFVPPILLVYQIELTENTNISLPSNIKFSTHFPLINYSNFRWQKYLKNSHRKFPQCFRFHALDVLTCLKFFFNAHGNMALDRQGCKKFNNTILLIRSNVCFRVAYSEG